MFGSKHPTKELVLEILSQRPQLTLSQLHTLCKQDYASTVSYQAIHKMVRECVEDNILLKKDKRYKLNPEWISKGINFFTQAQQQLSVTSEQPLQMKKVDHIELFTFSSLSEFDHFLFSFESRFHRNKPSRQVYWHARHYWWPLIYSKQMFDIQQHKQNKKNSYKICQSTHPLDQWAIHYYQLLGVNAYTVKKCNLPPYMGVYDDTILDIAIPKTIQSTLSKLFTKHKTLTTTTIKEILTTLNISTRIQVTIQQHPSMAHMLRETIKRAIPR